MGAELATAAHSETAGAGAGADNALPAAPSPHVMPAAGGDNNDADNDDDDDDDAALNEPPYPNGGTPLWRAVSHMAYCDENPGATHEQILESVAAFRALIAKAAADGSGVSIVDTPHLSYDGSRVTRYATPRACYRAAFRMCYGCGDDDDDDETLFATAVHPAVETALQESDAAVARVRAYPLALPQHLRDAVQPSLLSSPALQGVLHIVVAYAVVPALPPPPLAPVSPWRLMPVAQDHWDDDDDAAQHQPAVVVAAPAPPN